MTPTPEQLSIISAAQSTSSNLLISALAGAAKTSTLVLIAEALPSVQILCLAFNKKIADEMQSRLPDNCKAMTLNSLGHRVWGDAIGRRLRIDASKTYDIVSILFDKLGQFEKKECYENLSDLLRTIDFGKACGWIPDEFRHPVHRPRPLLSNDEFFAHIDEDYPDFMQDLIIEASLISLKKAFEGECDYNDQILMPTVFSGAFPRYPLTLIDEAQDLSALNHAMLRKIVGTGEKARRLIAVGDPCQAIYGFRGAHEESMDLLRKEFSMTELMLSVSFRCPISIVKHAQWRAPHMKWPEWAKEGSIRYLSSWAVDDLEDNAAVICRNNAPLFGLAIKLLKNGRYAEIMGNDVGKGLIKIMKKFGPTSLSQSGVMDAIADWEEEKIAKSKKRAETGIRDRGECMRVFARQGENLGDAIAYAKHVFAAKGPIKLMTGHKSKGLEFDDVWFMDEQLVGDEGQDRNLRYVIQTRSKERLTYVKLADFIDA
jgi:superfamily I DNA/RNA helicase